MKTQDDIFRAMSADRKVEVGSMLWLLSDLRLRCSQVAFKITNLSICAWSESTITLKYQAYDMPRETGMEQKWGH